MSEPNKAVFLSYASQDAEAAQRICEALRAAGIEIWFDQSELRGGDAWDQKIHQQIRDCALFVPIISANTAARPEGYFRLEWALADRRTEMIARNKAFVVPVCIDRTPDSAADVPDSFHKVQWTRLPGAETPAAFCERIRVLLDGVEATARPPSAETPPLTPAAKRKSHRWQFVAGAGVLVALVGGWQAWQRITHQSKGPTAQPSAATAIVAPEKSIAVLPFVDMSEKKDQEYFSDGLSEELIDNLAHNTDLKVIARTSSFAFKGKNQDMRTIASQLGVANLLEGSVRKQGLELRITAQLIRASDGVHLWSQSYERNLTDVFKVQEEIAATVASALKATLQAGGVATGEKAVSAEAHNLYLQGRYFAARATLDDLNTAVNYYEKAVQLDSGYGAAWAALSTAYAWNAQYGDVPVAETTEKARSAAQTALRLDPRLAEAHSTLALIHSSYDYNWVGARSEVERAVALDPHSPENLVNAGRIAMAFGELDKAAKLYRGAVAIDPLRADAYMSLGVTLFYANRLEDSMTALRACAKLSPGKVKVQFLLGQVALAQGHPQAAHSFNAAETAPWYRDTGLAIIEDAQGNRAASDAALARLLHPTHEPATAQIAEVYAHRGDLDSAFKWLELGLAQRDPGLRWLKVDVLYAPLRGDPRYRLLLKKLGLPET